MACRSPLPLFLVLAACAQSSSVPTDDDLGEGGGGGGGGAPGREPTMVVALEPEGTVAQPLRLADVGGGQVVALVAFAPDAAPWPDFFPNARRFELIRVASDGAVVWRTVIVDDLIETVTRAPLLGSTATGDVLVAFDRRLSVFDASGVLREERDFGGLITAVSEAPAGGAQVLLALDPDEAPTYGFPVDVDGVGVVVRGDEAIEVLPFSSSREMPMVLDENGVTWVGSHLDEPSLYRLSADDEVTVIGVPEIFELSTREGGGVWAKFRSRLAPLDPPLDGLAQGIFWVAVDGAGAVQPEPRQLPFENALVASTTLGELLLATEHFYDGGSALWERERLYVGQLPVPAYVTGTGRIAHHALVATADAFWFSGTFNGHLDLFGEELRAGTAFGVPFLVRIDGEAYLPRLGASLAACAASSEACQACIEGCAPRCAIVEECSFSVENMAKCVCQAPEHVDECAAMWDDPSIDKVSPHAACYATTCRDVCAPP